LRDTGLSVPVADERSAPCQEKELQDY